MMLGRFALCGVVLFCLLWPEDVDAGSSFLSPADMQKNAGKKIPKKLQYNNLHRRESGSSWEDPGDEGSEDPEEMEVAIPLDINLRLTAKQFQRQRAAIQDLLLGLFSSTPDTAEEQQA
ncbi:hypothetical protein GDO81_027233 [Engystomops pustulosus]|uniref:Uncharacterized protein n=1 Tax=Engystomops pustulosus TaxID=76066 RepID=A0AAV6ZI09_ENGPU|nr:hypothetical protein GDO81_027233 [Engystomops pustulosus]